MRLIVLAADEAVLLRPLTDDRPAALVPFLGRPLLDWALTAAKSCGLADVTVVGGYKSERLADHPLHLMRNHDYASNGVVGTLMTAEAVFGDAFAMSYGNIAYRPELLRALIDSPAEIGVVVDLDWQAYWQRRFGDPLRDAESLRMSPDGNIRSIGQTVSRIEDVQGQFVGLVVFRGRGIKTLRRAWIRAKTDFAYHRPVLGHTTMLSKLAMTDLLDELTTGDVPVKAIPVHGGWAEIESPEDIVAAEERWAAYAAASPIQAAPAAEPLAPVASQTLGVSAAAVPAGFDFTPYGQPIFHRVRRW
jgi:choline kinase